MKRTAARCRHGAGGAAGLLALALLSSSSGGADARAGALPSHGLTALLSARAAVESAHAEAGKSRPAQVGGSPFVRPVGEDLYAYISDNEASCNSTFLVGSDGVLVVDTGFSRGEAEKLLAAIRSVTRLPVRYILNTHYHRDHQAGNGAFEEEAVVVATTWTRERTFALLSDPRRRWPPEALYRLPVLTFSHALTIHLGKHRVELSHPGKAHTSGDALVYFPGQRVMAMGDLFLTNCSPAMDQGSVFNWIEVLSQALRGPAETFVPGHFALATKSELGRFRDYLASLRDQVSRLRAKGASLEEVRARVHLPEFADFRQYPQFGATFADNAEVVYRELATR